MQNVKPSASALNYSKLKTKIHNIYIFFKYFIKCFYYCPSSIFNREYIFIYIFNGRDGTLCSLESTQEK